MNTFNCAEAKKRGCSVFFKNPSGPIQPGMLGLSGSAGDAPQREKKSERKKRTKGLASFEIEGKLASMHNKRKKKAGWRETE